jgi:prolyl oligopeptidase
MTNPVSTSPSQAPTYPPADRDDVVESLHGVEIADPYRYLEDPDAERTGTFVAAQNAVSEPLLEALPGRPRFHELTTALVTAPRAGVPWERGGRYFVVSNPGERDQDVLYTAPSASALLDGPDVLLDPNDLSADGTVALMSASVSDDGSLLAYALSEAGSDWRTIRIRDVDAGTDRPDELRWAKWVDPTWMPDGSGFLYWRYPAPSRAEFTDEMGAGELVLHRLGRAQDADVSVWSRLSDKQWMVDPVVTDDGRYVVFVAGPGTDSRTTVSARRLVAGPDGAIVPDGVDIDVVAELADAHHVAGSDGDVLFLRTERDAERGRLVAVRLDDPAAPWTEVVGQHDTDVLVSADAVSGGFVLVWSSDAAHRVQVVRRDGSAWADAPVDGPVSITAVHGRSTSGEVFLGSAAFTRPVRAHRLDLTADAVQLADLPAQQGVSLPAVRAERRMGRSADGTQVPMTVLRRADLPDGPHPTLLYGYGGFDVPVLPEFRAIFAAWVAAGGVLAVANLRGGGEFGVAWHHAGMLEHKQRVFDDFIGCAESLIADRITTAGQLAVHGRSNGGLLVGAVMTQRPELMSAALPTVGVLDMLRFHKFTIGWAWISEYGDPDDPELFPVLRDYSPLHRLVPGTMYPATLICTGDHDDRVVPAHSLKFGAELQRCQAGDAPILLRVDTRAGHGMGKPAHALAAEFADQLAFAAAHTGLDPLPA